MRAAAASSLLLIAIVGAFSPLPQGNQAEALLAQMTPEERVGQLFLLTFEDSSLQPDDPILALIRDNHISGVVLRSGNNNLVGPESTLPELRTLVGTLQSAEYEASLPSADGETEIEPGVYLPLLVGVIQEGNGPEYSEIMSGVSPTPSQMALGATWDPALSRETGEVIGSELSSTGINMLLGPSLDLAILAYVHSEGIPTGLVNWEGHLSKAFTRDQMGESV
jgi:beta-N-acetylhexosaminidase